MVVIIGLRLDRGGMRNQHHIWEKTGTMRKVDVRMIQATYNQAVWPYLKLLLQRA